MTTVSVESNGNESGWQKKLPLDWDENDTIDWLFEVARKRDDIPGEIILSGRYNSLTGKYLSIFFFLIFFIMFF